MHVALVRRFCSFSRAGAERYCALLARQLVRHGHRVTVLGEGIDDDLRGEVEFQPIAVQKTTTWTRNRSFAENCRAAIEQGNFDIAHGLSRVGGLDTFRLTDPLQTHWLNVFYQQPMWRWLQRINPRHRTILQLESELYRGTSLRRVVVQSQLDARLLQQYFQVTPDRIRLIPNGTDLTVFHPGVRSERAQVRQELGLPERAPVLMFAGMDFRRKGLLPLLKALPLLQRRDVQLLVVGTGDQVYYQAQARKLGVCGRVKFLGRRRDIPRLYGASDLFVLPTLYEPFPNVNLEAMASGTPVITSSTAGGADLVVLGQNGWLIDNPRDHRPLVTCIDEALSRSPQEQQDMQQACIETASRWTIDRNARSTIEMFEEVVREKSAA